jgi:hypothetical protein
MTYPPQSGARHRYGRDRFARRCSGMPSSALDHQNADAAKGLSRHPHSITAMPKAPANRGTVPTDSAEEPE